MAKPPAGSSLLFGALADSGRIKQRKNGSYRMVLKGVDEIDWFTDRPFRSEGLWKPQKLIRQWDSFFETSEPNAQASFKVGEERELITFEMFKPKYNSKTQTLSFEIDVEVINDRESDIVTGLKGKTLDEVSLFIDDATTGAPNLLQRCLSNDYRKVVVKDLDAKEKSLVKADLSEAKLYRPNLDDADLTEAKLIDAELVEAVLYYTDLTWANLSGADLPYARLHDVTLSGANLSNANLTGTRLDRTRLTDSERYGETRVTNLTNANLTRATLVRANLKKANLYGAGLKDAVLRKTDLTEAVLINANLEDVTWVETICPDGTMNEGTSPCTNEQLYGWMNT